MRKGHIETEGSRQKTIEDIPDSAIVPWNTGDFKLRKTVVFIERFFNKVPCKELAERFDVEENTIVCIYKQAVEQLDKIINALDARKEGLKAVKPDKFTDDQKYFLLTAVLKFGQAEVARMFNIDKN